MCVFHIVIAKTRRECGFLRFDLEGHHESLECDDQEPGAATAQEECPAGEHSDQTEIHRIARHAIQAADHQVRCPIDSDGIHSSFGANKSADLLPLPVL